MLSRASPTPTTMAIPLLKVIELCTPLALTALRLLDHRRTNFRHVHEAAGVNSPTLEQRLTELERADVEMAEVLTKLTQQLEELAKAAAADSLRAQRERRIMRQVLGGMVTLLLVGWAVTAWALTR